MSLFNWLSGNADTDHKLHDLDYQIAATNRWIMQRDETIQQLRKDIGNLQDNLYEAAQLIKLLQERIYRLESAKDIRFEDKQVNASISHAYNYYHTEIGGYDAFNKMIKGKGGKIRVYLHVDRSTKNCKSRWRFTVGAATKRSRSKSRMFTDRKEAEQFAFDLLQIHDGECTKRGASTKWWNGINIFQLVNNARPS